MAEYQVHYNMARPRQGIAQRVPDGKHDGGHLSVADLGPVHHGAVILHGDADFEHIAAMAGQVQKWIVSRGTLA